MRTNITALQHPTISRKLRISALKAWAAMLKAGKTGTNKRATEYVANRKGVDIIRIDVYPTGELVAYGDKSVNISQTVNKVLKLC